MQPNLPEAALRQMLDDAGLRSDVSAQIIAPIQQSTPDYDSLVQSLTTIIETLQTARGVARTVREPVGDDDAATAADDPWPWPPERLADWILAHEPTGPVPNARRLILAAEDIHFTPAQSTRLAPWLLAFAEHYRDSQDTRDAAVVWSALRTGASMLSPDEADRLLPLLEPGHPVDTSTVAVKMLARIFEAHPPDAADRFDGLSERVAAMASALLNPYAIDRPESAARAQLALCALGAMASHRLPPLAESAAALGGWFAPQAARRLTALRDAWCGKSPPVSTEVMAPLEQAVSALATGAAA